MPLAWAVLGAGALGAGAQIFGAQTGADAQRQAAQQAIAAQMQIYGENKANLQPFINIGSNAGNMLQGALPTLTTPFGAPAGSGATGAVDPTGLNKALEATPGYQFTLDQGKKATTNNFAAQGLGGSGALGKGLINYAEGLAGTTFQQQFQNYQNQNLQNYNILQGGTNTGVQAASSLAGVGTTTGQGVANSLTGAGNATAAANVASGNAVANAANNSANTYTQYTLLQNLLNKGGAGGTTTAAVQSPEYTGFAQGG